MLWDHSQRKKLCSIMIRHPNSPCQSALLFVDKLRNSTFHTSESMRGESPSKNGMGSGDGEVQVSRNEGRVGKNDVRRLGVRPRKKSR
jgi:hypothetical protein